ncbi:Odorant-binding protein A10 [Camponotus japonicus]
MILPVLFGVALAVSIAAEDTKTLVMFPSNGNATSLEMGGKIEPAHQPDMMTRPVPTTLIVPPQPQPMLPSDYFFPMPQRTFPHHRSENMPYGYEYPNIGYPVAHSMDHSISMVPSSKQLIVVSFIGLLLLLAIIQNTFNSAKQKDAIMDLLSSRQKRDVYATRDFRSVTPEEEEILNNDARVRCIQRTICLENRKLFRDLGAPGKMLAKHLTRDIEKSFKSPSGWDRLVRDAGAAGIRGDDCDVLYRDCDTPVTRKIRKVSSNVLPGAKDRDEFNSIR